MTNEEIMGYLRKAQELQMASFGKAHVSFHIDSQYTRATDDYSFHVNLFYGDPMELFGFNVGPYDSEKTIKVKFAVVEAILANGE